MNPRHLLRFAVLISAFLYNHVGGQELSPAEANARRFREQIQPLLARHCTACHGEQEPKGELRLSALTSDFTDPQNRERWKSVRDRVKAGEMPPQEKPRLQQEELDLLLGWIDAQIQTADVARRALQGRVALRRLNRVEYENTVCDLLGVKISLQDLLPPDSEARGFDKVAEGQHVSLFLMERYLEAADAALRVTIVNGPQPPLISKRYDCKEERYVKNTRERVFLHRDNALVFFSSSHWNAVTLGQFYPPHRGKYRFRISAYGYQSKGKPVTFRVLAGPMLMGTKNHLVDYFDAPADQPTVIEFYDHLEARDHINLLPHGLATAHTVNKIGAENYDGPGLAIQWIEVEGPLHDSWPPPSHRRIFGDLPQAPAPLPNQSNRVEVVSADPERDAQRILQNFARRAFRRPVSEDDLAPFMSLVRSRLAEGRSFEQAVWTALQAVLVSPRFLFLDENPGRLDDFALASRLSYFLWSTMPDDELLALAEQGKLQNPDTLRQQTERLLNDPRAAAFVENFVGQWLGLREIDATEPSHLLYPEYDPMLRVAMVREAELFFAEILKDDLSLANFVASDFSMLNGRLAQHYGIPGVEGSQFRKVQLPPNSHRGGVLTMAGVLKATANGTTTSPVYRGAWVLDRILGTPPPGPPSDVPAIEPDIRGATTIREQLAKHRAASECASCHAKIDPPGFATESFDVIGGWRERYRTTGHGDPVVVNGQSMQYREGLPVDPGDVLPDGRRFRNIDEYKQLLLTDIDQIARALTEKLLTYATGAPPDAADQADVEAMIRQAAAKNYGLRTLIHAIVQSKPFQHK